MIDHAKNVLKRIIDAESRILKEPNPDIVVEELGDNSVIIKLKLWMVNADYRMLITS